MPKGNLSLSLLLDQTTTLSTKNSVSLDPLKIDGSLESKNVVLNRYAPYYQEKILFNIEDGTLDLSTGYQYGKTDKDTITKLSNLSLALKSLRLKKKEESEPFLNLPLLTVQKTGVDLNQKTASIGEVSTQQGAVTRPAPERRKTEPSDPLPGACEERGNPGAVQEKAEQTEKPWLITLGKVTLDQYRVGFEDRMPEEPVTLQAEAIQLLAENFSTAKNSTGQASLSSDPQQKRGNFSLRTRRHRSSFRRSQGSA